MRTYGIEGKFNYMVIDLLGESLESMRVRYGGKVERDKVVEIGIQMINNRSKTIVTAISPTAPQS